ncbi:MAG TPA: hypothetical protein VGO80_19685 [Solirubrobacteraceae bacterium]|nr:hypothetical protein [Solirubrobacteraceae bacterium]
MPPVLGAALVSSDLCVGNFRAHDPEYHTPDTTVVALGLAA